MDLMTPFHATHRGECDQCHRDDVAVRRRTFLPSREWQICRHCSIPWAQRAEIETLTDQIREDVFELLDGEVRISGEIAGQAAHEAEQAVRAVLDRYFSE